MNKHIGSTLTSLFEELGEPVPSPNKTTSARRERTDEERRYYEILRSCTFLNKRPRQKPLPKHLRGRVDRGYTVTTIAPSDRYGGTRTVVVCKTFQRAREIVEKNRGDIFETTYHLAVIEAIAFDGLYTYLDEAYWYKWDGDYESGRYRPIAEPEAFKGVVSHGIG